MLSEAEMSPADVVSVTTYVVVGEELAPRDARPRRVPRRAAGRLDVGHGAGAGATGVAGRDRDRGSGAVTSDQRAG